MKDLARKAKQLYLLRPEKFPPEIVAKIEAAFDTCLEFDKDREMKATDAWEIVKSCKFLVEDGNPDNTFDRPQA